MIIEIEVDKRELELDFDDNQMYWKQHTSWFGNLLMNGTDPAFVDYALNSADYHNRLVNFYFVYYKLHLPHLEEYVKNAEEVIEAIDAYTANS